MKITDQCGHELELKTAPGRIVSLVPSQTELLAYLGLDEQVVGITRFCVHPKNWHQTKKRVGGTKDPKLNEILKLAPDLVLANLEENNKEDVEFLRRHCPVYTSDVNDLPSSLAMVRDVGKMCDRGDAAEKLASEIQSTFENLVVPEKRPKVLYLIWYCPWMGAGSSTFIDSMMDCAGLDNVLASASRYPQLSMEEIAALRPDVIFLSSEPFPFKQKHAEELKTRLPDCKMVFVDGEMFSWYGPRLLMAPAYFTSLRGNL